MTPKAGAAVGRQAGREVNDDGDVVFGPVGVDGGRFGLGAARKALIEDAVFLGRIGVPTGDAYVQQALQPAFDTGFVIDGGAALAGHVLQFVIGELACCPMHAGDVIVETILGKHEVRMRLPPHVVPSIVACV